MVWPREARAGVAMAEEDEDIAKLDAMEETSSVYHVRFDLVEAFLLPMGAALRLFMRDRKSPCRGVQAYDDR